MASDSSGAAFRAALPCENWKLASADGKPATYRYSDKSGAAGACTKAMIRDGKALKIQCKGREMGFNLREGMGQGTVRAWLDVGEAETLCLAFNAIDGKDGSNSKVLNARNSLAPVSCN